MFIGKRAFLSVGRRGNQIGMPSAALDADAAAWQSAVIANGGTVSAGRLTIVNTFIAAEKAAAAWDLTDDYWPLWAENAPQALTSLKQRRLAAVTAAPAFTADRGYTFDGATNFVDTGFVPSTHAVAMTGLNMRLAVYERTAVSAAGFAAGVTTTATTGLRLSPRITAGFIAAIMNGTSTSTAGIVPASLGFTTAFKAAAATYGFYKNGLLFEAYDPAAETTVLGGFALFIGATSTSGVAASFRASSIGFVCVGASLTAPQELAQYNNVQAWATAIGAQV